MCGIAGCWQKNSTNRNSSKVTIELLNSIAHRGPDGDGMQSLDQNRLALGHKRLSILDLSIKGEQPMTFRNRWTITYNGEIYNFLELRYELELKGYRFISDSDTEVILASYAEWGEECLDRFNGMWAFAIWDNVEKTLFLSRDRFGVKPLYYYYENGKRFAFASEIKAFRESSDFSTKLDPEMVISLLHEPNCLDPYGLTPYTQIRILPAGSSLKIEQGLERLAIASWWKLNENPAECSNQEIEDTFSSLFEDACKLRMRSDVALATALSGGLDSSSIYAKIRSIAHGSREERRAPGTHNKCYTMSFPSSSDDELQFAEKVAKYYRESCNVAQNKIGYLSDELCRITHNYGDFSPNPILSLEPIYKLMSEQQIKVSLDGHGGDECLLGYPDMIESLIRITKDKEKKILEKTLSEMLHNPNYTPYNNRIPLSAKTRIALGKLKQVLGKHSKKSIKVREHGAHQIDRKDFHLPEHVIQYRNEVKELKQSVFGIHKASIEYERLPLILRNFDKASMLSGVEIRAPLLDYRLVEFCCNLPLRQKTNFGYSKFILRKSMSESLPRDIAWRKHKIGINAPLQNWFSDENFINFSKEKIDQIHTYVKPLLNTSTKIDSLFESSKHDVTLSWYFLNLSMIKYSP